jgi:hypothetical protein
MNYETMQTRKDQALNTFAMPNGKARSNERRINKLGYANWWVEEKEK